MGRTKTDPHRKKAKVLGKKLSHAQTRSSLGDEQSGTTLLSQQAPVNVRGTADSSVSHANINPRSPLRPPNHLNPTLAVNPHAASVAAPPTPTRLRNPTAAPGTPPRQRNIMPPPVNASTPISSQNFAHPPATPPQSRLATPHPPTPRPASRSPAPVPRSPAPAPRSPARLSPEPRSPAHRSLEPASATGNPGRRERSGPALSAPPSSPHRNLNANQNANQPNRAPFSFFRFHCHCFDI